jgi:hypothetical protein
MTSSFGDNTAQNYTVYPQRLEKIQGGFPTPKEGRMSINLKICACKEFSTISPKTSRPQSFRFVSVDVMSSAPNLHACQFFRFSRGTFRRVRDSLIKYVQAIIDSGG